MKLAQRRRRHRIAPRAPGITLIELMVSLVLGLLITGAVLTVFLANQQTYAATESLGRIQENARTAFELMARDLREGGGNACGAALANTVSVLDPAGVNFGWYTDFAAGIRGYDEGTAFPDAAFGLGAAQRVSGTDAVELKSSFSNGVTIEKHTPAAASFKVNTTDHRLAVGDIAMACDSNHAAIFQVTNAQPGVNATIVHSTGTVSPGNCTKGLGTGCDAVPAPNAVGSPYEFGCMFGGLGPPGLDCTLAENRWAAVVAQLRASRWYIGYNGRGGKSLYQSAMRNEAGALVVDANEVAEGVDNLTLEYLSNGGDEYQSAAGVGDWANVTAVRIRLALTDQQRVGTDGNPLTRNLDHVVAIRNRTP